MYNPITSSDIAYFKAALAPERVLTGAEISRDYSHDELGGVERMPELLIRAESTEEVSESTDPTQIALMRGIKDVFDPNRILNPGKIF